MSNSPRNRNWWLTHQLDGCNLHDHCLTCLLPQCQFDSPTRRGRRPPIQQLVALSKVKP